MKKSFFVTILLVLITHQYILAQDTIAKEEVYSFVDQMPEFPGGEMELMIYLGNEIQYPELARENNISGKVVAEFIVLSNGSIAGASIKKDIGFGCGEEVLRVLKKMPKWKPGMQDGKVVNVYFTLPVMFDLIEDKPIETSSEEASEPFNPYLNMERGRIIKKYMGVR